MEIDVTFDFRSDSNGADPDSASPQLRKYHQILWSKSLPNGLLLGLSESEPKSYLVATINDKKFTFRSDSISNSYANSKSKEIKQVISLVDSKLVQEFFAINCTIGAYIIFPGNRVNEKMTINGARGFNKYIADRFDLTLECIKRFYNSEPSPLSKTLDRYSDFFKLFSNFDGYVDFFLLQDLVKPNGKVDFFTEVKVPFVSTGYPRTIDEYLEYKENSIKFVNLRNLRIRDFNLKAN